jgi:CBS domain-containing protein
MLCGEIMKRHVQRASVGTSALQAARLMRDQRIGFLPVCDTDDHPLGVVTDRDLASRVCAENLNAAGTFLSSVMTPNPLCCRDTHSLEHAKALMARGKHRRILVVDARGRLTGLITLADVAHHQEPFRMAQSARALTENGLQIEK